MANAGQSFSDWNAERDAEEEEDENGERTRNKNRARAQRQLTRLMNRGSMLSRFDRKRISRLKDYLGDDAVSAAQKEVGKAKRREEKGKKDTEHLKKIEQYLSEIKDGVGI